MRRRRSETISAQDYNEFLRLSQTPAPTAALKARARNSLPDSNLFSQAKPRQASHIPEIPSQFKNKIKDSSKIGTTCQDYWEGMDFDQDGTKTPTTNAGSFNSLHKTSMDKDMLGMEAEQLERDSKNIKRMNVMVVGAKGSGRHRLVSSLFREGNDDNDHGIRSAFDLIIKKGGRDGQDLFKFWVKDACCEGYMHLFKSYYQMADMFIFVYQVNDRSSFECLEKAIKQAKDEIKCKDFVGFLIAEKNENYECDRKVLYNEGEEVKEKYGLQGFFETSFEDNEEQNKFLNTLFPEDLKVDGE